MRRGYWQLHTNTIEFEGLRAIQREIGKQASVHVHSPTRLHSSDSFAAVLSQHMALGYHRQAPDSGPQEVCGEHFPMKNSASRLTLKKEIALQSARKSRSTQRAKRHHPSTYLEKLGAICYDEQFVLFVRDVSCGSEHPIYR